MDKKLLTALLITPSVFAVEAQQRPNVVMIVVDDLGYSDLEAYGNPSVRTPNIDRLGQDGLCATHAYCSSPISGPSRAGIMTGRCQNRFGCEFMPYDRFDRKFMRSYIRYFALPYVRKTEGLKDFSPSVKSRIRNYKTDIPSSEIIISEVMKQAGYATGLVGKWNLGSDACVSPAEHGYDYSYYFTGALTRYVDGPDDDSGYVNVALPWAFSDIPAWQPRRGPTAIRENGREVEDRGYLTFSFADKAVRFIDDHHASPFFLTLTFNAPHDPFQAPKAYWDRIDEDDPVKRVYYAMIEALDDAVGNVLEALDSHGIYDNTLIVFTSDNGGASYTRATDNAPLIGGKCTFFEGGLRVPFYIKYPAGVLPAGIVYDRPVSLLDIFPTVAAACGISLPADREYDGVNLLPYLNGTGAGQPHPALYWRSGYDKACLVGGWKLYISGKDKRTQLYNLADDPYEYVDLSEQMPDKVQELKELLMEWERDETVEPLWPSSGDLRQKVDGVYYHFPV